MESYVFRFKDRQGREKIVAVHDCQTQEEAKLKAIDLAKSEGYSPPKWWQFWIRR